MTVPVPGGPETAAAEEKARLRAALEHVGGIHGRNAWHPDTGWPTELAREWHNGYITCAAEVSIAARRALDPKGAAEDDERDLIAARGTDSEWWAATGHCGGCGTVASSCDCDGACGCWEDHGPPLSPWRSLPAQLTEAQAEIARLRAALAAAPGGAEPATDREGLRAALDDERAARRIAGEAADRFRDVLSEVLGHEDENPGDDALVAEIRAQFGRTGPEPTRWRDFLTGARAKLDQIEAMPDPLAALVEDPPVRRCTCLSADETRGEECPVHGSGLSMEDPPAPEPERAETDRG